MNTYRIIAKAGLMTICLILVIFLVIAIGCDGLTSFHVSKISLYAPDWVEPYEYTYKVVVNIKFSRAVDTTSFKAPGTVNINVKGLSSGNIAASIAGTFRFSNNDPRTAVFISDKTLSDLINPSAAENIEYTISLDRDFVRVVYLPCYMIC